MARQQKFDYEAALENDLIAHPGGLTLDQLLERSGFKVDRSTLFRHLSRLIEQGRAERIGKARASRYRPLAAAEIGAQTAPANTERLAPAGVAAMLASYLPNATPFLTAGEVQRLHLAGQAEIPATPPGSHAGHIYERLATDLAHASSRLEGGSYSVLETERLLKHGEVPAARDQREAVMILNHREAIRYIVDNLASVDLTGQDLLHLYALMSRGLLAPPESESVLPAPADAVGSAYVAADSRSRCSDAVDTLSSKLLQVKEPFEQAFCLLVFLPGLQLFEGGDKGCSRVALNIPLLKHDLSPLSFIGVDEHAYRQGAARVYESNDTAMLKQIFIEGYVRSAGNYRLGHAATQAVPSALPEYGAIVKKTVRTIVRDWKRFSSVNLQIYLSLLVKPDYLSEVAAEVEKELADLNQDNLAAFGLSPAEFAAFAQPAGLQAARR